MNIMNIETEVNNLIKEVISDEVDCFFMNRFYTFTKLIFSSLILLEDEVNLNQIKKYMSKDELRNLKTRLLKINYSEISMSDLDNFIESDNKYQKSIFAFFTASLSKLSKERMEKEITFN